MRCPDHARDLVDHACPLCSGRLMSEDELNVHSPGASARLKLETRQDSLAFKKPRACPQCEVPMSPLRIEKMEAWVERCAGCEVLWVEKADLRTLTMLQKTQARQRGYDSLSEREKAEMAKDLAEATHVSTGPDLNLAGSVLVAAGVPLLDKVHGNKTPWVTISLIAAVVAAFVASGPDALAYPAGSLDPVRLFTSTFAHFGWLHLIGNLGFFVVLGDAVEQKVPRWALAMGVLLLGPLSIFLDSLTATRGELIGGASGAVAVLFGAAVVLQKQAKVSVMLGKSVPVSLPLWAYGGFWIAVQTCLWLLSIPGVAWVAHISGFLIGLAGAVAYERLFPPPPSS